MPQSPEIIINDPVISRIENEAAAMMPPPPLEDRIADVLGGVDENERKRSQEIAYWLRKTNAVIQSGLRALSNGTLAGEAQQRVERYVFDRSREKVRTVGFERIRNKGDSTSPEESTLQQNLMKKRGSWDALKTSDILLLKRQNADLTALLFVDRSGTDKTVDGRKPESLVGRTLMANFGKNRALHDQLWAGDILPQEVDRVRIGGIEWVRGNDPRPGYYQEKGNGRRVYLPIYDGTEVEILSTRTLSDTDKASAAQAENEQYTLRRRYDIEEAMLENPEAGMEEFNLTEEDKVLAAQVKADMGNLSERRTERMRARGVSSLREFTDNRNRFVEVYRDVINTHCRRFGVPPELLLQLFWKESKFNPAARPIRQGQRLSSAHGLGQIIDDTWAGIQGRLSGERLDRFDPEDQILASAEYLSYIKNVSGQTWDKVFVLYHTGEGFPTKGADQVITNLNRNPAVAEFYDESQGYTPEAYMAAAAQFYEVDRFKNATFQELEYTFSWSGSERSVWETSTAPVAKIDIPANGLVAVIGDSHTAGMFGNSLKDRLLQHLHWGNGQITSFTGVSSASVQHFLSGSPVGNISAPSLDTVLSKSPQILVVALGSNMLGNSVDYNKQQIRELLERTDPRGTQVVWIGPPNMRAGRLQGNSPEERFYQALSEVNAERVSASKPSMAVIDSRKSTNESDASKDGIHFSGAAAEQWAKAVADEMVLTTAA